MEVATARVVTGVAAGIQIRARDEFESRRSGRWISTRGFLGYPRSNRWK